MGFQPASSVSVATFTVIVIAVVAAFFVAVRYAGRGEPDRGRTMVRRAAIIGLIYLGLLTSLVASGRMAVLPMSGVPFFFGIVAVFSIAVGLSPFGGSLARGVPVKYLVLFQAFRLPLELVLHAWGEQGTIPTSMTWNGQNWDVVSGCVALLAFPWAGRHRAVAWGANVIGFALLLNVMRVALLSSPVPFGWNVTPPLLLALHLPYALIGPVCVGGALIGHLVLTRALLRQPVG